MLGVKVKKLASFLRLPAYALLSVFAWIFIVPITFLVPRNKNWIAVIGRQEGKFLDNTKYFFLQANQDYQNKRFVFISEDMSVVSRLNNHGFEAFPYPSFKSIIFLLRCGVFVVDEATWFSKLRFFLLFGATSVQLWHGVWCKYIELSKWQHEQGRVSWSSKNFLLNVRLFLYRLTGRRMTYDIVIATSEFYKREVFQPAFLAKKILITGYPRNNFGLNLFGQYKDLAWSNVDVVISKKLQDFKKVNKKIVLIAPTFRDSGTMPMQLISQDFELLNKFAFENNYEFVFKLHPSDINKDFPKKEHLHIYQRDKDIYPLFPCFDALISDYSSISMDFLHCDKPILFFIPENDTYLECDRQLQFDPKNMMPGPIVKDIKELMSCLLAEIDEDNFQLERKELKCKAFANIDQAKAVQEIFNSH